MYVFLFFDGTLFGMVLKGIQKETDRLRGVPILTET